MKVDYTNTIKALYDLKNNVNELDNLLSNLKTKLSETVINDNKILNLDEYNKSVNNTHRIKSNISTTIIKLSNY